MYNSSEMVDPKSVQLPVDKTRRKRLKVKPCAGCIKTNMDCKYLNSPKSRPSNNRPLAASSATSASPPPTCLATSPSHQQAPRYYQPTQQPQPQQQPNDKPNSTIQAIEARLGVIENILQILLKQQQQQQQQQQQYHPYHHQQKSAFVPVEQRNMQAHHSGPYHGEYQHDETNSGYHYGQSHKRKFDQVQQQQQSNVRLAPPHNYQPSLSESSSTSTTSSICSNSSPKMNTIQALLNNENEIKLDYSSSKPSAFYRPNPTIATTGSSNNVY
ncbi:hypothetical protein PS6_000394 [Mucor atramentarius]